MRVVILIYVMSSLFSLDTLAMNRIKKECHEWAREVILTTFHRPLCDDIVDGLAEELSSGANTRVIYICENLDERNIKVFIGALKKNRKVISFKLPYSPQSIWLSNEFVDMLKVNYTLEELELFNATPPNETIKHLLTRNKGLKKIVIFYEGCCKKVLQKEIVIQIWQLLLKKYE
jgi:hypothetical protein